MTKVQIEQYSPTHDRWLYRGIAGFLAIVAALGISTAIVLAVFDQHDIALITIGIGTTCTGALAGFFTQHVGR